MPPSITAINWQDWNAQVSEFFTVGEVFNYDVVRRQRATLTVRRNVLVLADRLDVLRRQWGPLGVTSWFRDPESNAAVGGSSRSYHITGLAADIYPHDANPRDFEDWLDANWKGGVGYGVRSGRGFTHLDLGPYARWHY